MALWSNTDAAASKPKNLTTDEKNATLGVSADEAQESGNKANGLNTPGWVKYTTYTDAQSNTRHKSEVLVAMGTITGDNDAIDPDPVITIGTQPSPMSVTDPTPATFTVSGTITRGAVLRYQWQVSTDAGVTFTNMLGKTAATLVVEAGDAQYVTGNQFRALLIATGATPVTSAEATLTVA